MQQIKTNTLKFKNIFSVIIKVGKIEREREIVCACKREVTWECKNYTVWMGEKN